MARLSKILGAILQDMISAQHEANLYALRLSAAYRDRQQAAALNPPAVCLGEMELMLHCGFTEEPTTDLRCEIDRTLVTRAIRDLSSDLSEVIVTTILATVVRQEEESGEEGPLARMRRERTLRRNVIAFLGRTLHASLNRRRTELVAADGSPDLTRILETVLLVADEKILAHPDLEPLFAEDASGALRTTIRDNLRSNVAALLPRILKEMRFGRQRAYASLDVTVSAAALADLPDECIQTLRLKISPRDLPIETEHE